MRSRLLTLAAFLLPGTALIAFGQEKKENGVDCKYFTISVPKDFKLDTKTPVEDFDIITISKGEQVYVGIYAGNNPNYPLYIKREGKKEIEESKLGDVETISEWRGDKLLRKEMKIRLPNKQFPQFLHIFYGDVDKDTVMISERIVSSLKLKKGTDQKVHK
jgi:hypothetical protein